MNCRRCEGIAPCTATPECGRYAAIRLRIVANDQATRALRAFERELREHSRAVDRAALALFACGEAARAFRSWWRR